MSNQTSPQSFTNQIKQIQESKNTFLCLGFDPDINKMPAKFAKNPAGIKDFCIEIAKATHDIVCAFKPQIAYFAANNAENELRELILELKKIAPNVPIILDAKRGDIGATAKQYAKEAFERYMADAVTLSPFMGLDSLEPFFEYKDKGIFLLCRTSNSGGDDIQNLKLSSELGNLFLYEYIAKLAAEKYNPNGQTGLVIGATYPKEIENVRKYAPHLPLLVPGVGAQGGSAIDVIKANKSVDNGVDNIGNVIINSSRAILYASNDDNDFQNAARNAALKTIADMQG